MLKDFVKNVSSFILFGREFVFLKTDIKEDNFKFQKLRRTLLVRRRRRWIRTRLRNTLNTAQPG